MRKSELIGTWMVGAAGVATALAGRALYWRWLDHRETMAEMFHITPLTPGLYEQCPECDGECDGCLRCFDVGVVPHEC